MLSRRDEFQLRRIFQPHVRYGNPDVLCEQDASDAVKPQKAFRVIRLLYSRAHNMNFVCRDSGCVPRLGRISAGGI